MRARDLWSFAEEIKGKNLKKKKQSTGKKFNF